LILFFALRAVPVKELGKIWAKAQTESVMDKDAPSDGDADQDEATVKEKMPLNVMLPRMDMLALSIHFSSVESIMLHYSDKLPHSFIPEIPTPPPNFIG
jgi:hypothetical protein